jgi:hypothetical protein
MFNIFLFVTKMGHNYIEIQNFQYFGKPSKLLFLHKINQLSINA